MKWPHEEICGDRANLAALVETEALGDPRVQNCLRAILAPELETQRFLPPDLVIGRWWVSRSHAPCDGCGARMCRCSVGGCPDSPIYVCVSCGLVMSARAVSERGVVTKAHG